jgi:hypothetical protein
MWIGYALRCEWAHGWWRERRALTRGPMAEGVEYTDASGNVRLNVFPLTEMRTCWRELHPSIGTYWPPLRGHQSTWSAWLARAKQVALPLLRARLYEETGYESIYTTEECSDAARVYGARTMGAKAILGTLRAVVRQ